MLGLMFAWRVFDPLSHAIFTASLNLLYPNREFG
jgi:hypothetical protein